MLRDILIALSKSDVMRRFSMNAPGSRTVSRRFVAGEKLDEGIDAVRRLAETGFFVTMDYLGESVTSREEATSAADMYLRMLDRLATGTLSNGELLKTRANVSLKLTQMGQDIPVSDVDPTPASASRTAGTPTPAGASGTSGTPTLAGASGTAGANGAAVVTAPSGAPALAGASGTAGANEAAVATATAGATETASASNAAGATSAPCWPKPAHGMTPEEGRYDVAFLRANVGRIVDRAQEHGIFVRFDMESRFHTQRTLDFVRRLWQEGYRDVGIVLQSYMLRTEHDARVADSLAMRVRLCKGAYREPPEVAFQEKTEVDRNFVQVATLLVSEGHYPGIATHDSAMIRATLDFARKHGIDRSRFEFQMLYGVRRDLQLQLLQEGYNVRVYVPFGEAWYAYLMRRMAERPGNVMFIVNAVLRESPLGGIFGRNGR